MMHASGTAPGSHALVVTVSSPVVDTATTRYAVTEVPPVNPGGVKPTVMEPSPGETEVM